MTMKDSLFNSNDIDSLIKLVDLFTSADGENKIYKINPNNYDYLVDLVKNNNEISDDEKKKFIEKINIRKINQDEIEKISLGAKDIKNAEELLEEHEREI